MRKKETRYCIVSYVAIPQESEERFKSVDFFCPILDDEDFGDIPDMPYLMNRAVDEFGGYDVSFHYGFITIEVMHYEKIPRGYCLIENFN